MNKREAAIITAYTNVMCGEFSDFQKYVEEKFGRPVLSHEFASKEFTAELRQASKEDFLSLAESIGDES